MTNLAKREQEKRRTILILIKNQIQEKLEHWETLWKRSDWSFIKLKDLYDDLQNFLYGEFCWEPYLVSIEEVDYYVNLYREIKKSDEERLKNYLANN